LRIRSNRNQYAAVLPAYGIAMLRLYV
jgi:hypothetical protein